MTVRANVVSSKVKTLSANGISNYPTGLGSDDEGLTIFDSQLKTLVFWNGSKWNQVLFTGPPNGSSVNSAILNFSDWAATSPSSGEYWVRPNGYGGTAEKVYIAVNDSSQSTITAGGIWVRLRYAQSYYSRSNAWRGQGGLSNPANESTTAYSGNFDYEQSMGFIGQLLQPGSYIEIRQVFESWGYGSVGWTYGSGYMESRGFDGVNYTRWNGNQNIVGVGYNRTTGMSHKIDTVDDNQLINEPFNNPTLRGLDRTDANDSTWRNGRLGFRFVPSNNTDSRLPLPILGIYNADVDGGSEQRYFPFRDSAGGWTGNGESNIWVKVVN